MRETTFEPPSEQHYAIALPCTPADFGNFIGSLLGKPQTISGVERGAFELGRDDIINSYHLVTQRVMQQNEAQLIQFVVRLVFDDNSSVLLSSLDDFVAYTEVRPVIVTQAHLSWSFLVQFRDRSHPEKQEIDLSFLTAERGSISLDEENEFEFFSASRSGGRIAFRIRHTARTWGADIESLLSGHARHLVLPQARVRAFAQKHSGKIATTIALLFFTTSIAACFFSADRLAADQLNGIASLLQKHDAFDLKLDKLLQLSAAGFWGKFFFSLFIFVIFSSIFSVMIGTWAESAADNNRPSHILLTKKSEQHKVEQDKHYKFQWLSFLASISVSIATGVVSNVIFAKYWAS